MTESFSQIIIPCSVYIISKNCEEWIKNTLNSVKNFAEVIIVDSGSTDKTLEIASQFANVTIYQQEWLGFAQQKTVALNYCQQKWVLNLDGDEVCSEKLKQEILQIAQQDSVKGLIIPINDYFLNRKNSEFTKKHAKIRCFQQAFGQYDLTNIAHEQVIINGKTQVATGCIYHFGENSILTKVDKNNRYSELKAIEKFRKNKQPSLLKLITIMPIMFIKSYILRRNFLNGWRGFVGSMINAFYAFLKEAKLFEKYLQISHIDDNISNEK